MDTFDSAAVVRFVEAGKSGRRAEHDAVLIEHARSHTNNYIDLPSLTVHDFFGWRDAFGKFIVAVKARLERPIDLVVDMTCLPKYYLLLILGFSVKAGAVRSITFFYAEGQYAPVGANSTLAADHAFTQGEWTSFPVPYLEGELNPDRKIRIIASVGFETFQARKFIRSYEAERHILVTPKPGFTVEYEERSEAESQALASNLDVPIEDVIQCSAGGVVATSAAVISVLDSDKRFNEVGLCLGTKPQALGFGIAAQLRSHFTLVCRVPGSYVETDTPPLGRSWTYTINDLSAAPTRYEQAGVLTA
ncbi:hypothetical protein GCM10022280_21620 [Sphingomonas swuensis]|uniref:Uncharacterized protein n=1 Tax=Sphingomonas swuensis TaxID=977800 RepID=A0ABP7T4A0_9SPHN